MRKLLSSVFLFFVLIASANDKFLVNDFESGLGGAGNAWGGVCEWIDNPLKDVNNSSSKVLKVSSSEFAATSIPFTLPNGKVNGLYGCAVTIGCYRCVWREYTLGRV